MRFTDEQVLEKIARAYNGDDFYVYNLPMNSPNYDYKDFTIPITELATMMAGADSSLE